MSEVLSEKTILTGNEKIYLHEVDALGNRVYVKAGNLISGNVLTVSNYDELRNLTNYNHDVVIVDDWTYTGPDGNTYTTFGGVFKRIYDRVLARDKSGEKLFVRKFINQ